MIRFSRLLTVEGVENNIKLEFHRNNEDCTIGLGNLSYRLYVLSSKFF